MVSASRLHAVHPYPCKFPPAVALEHLSPETVILDPYCGSGTTLLEAAVQGHAVVGVDCNPIAVLVSRCKLIRGGTSFVAEGRRAIESFQQEPKLPFSATSGLPDFHGRDHWFMPHVQAELAGILEAIDRVAPSGDLRVVLQTALSSIVNRVSNQDSETRYARVERDVPPGATSAAFISKARAIIDSIEERGELSRDQSDSVHLADIRDGLPVPAGSIDLIITSPPYANTMDYYLYHKQRMNILGFSFRDAMNAEIGSRHEFSSKKAAPDKWFADYLSGIKEMARTLRSGGSAIVIIGDSQIAGDRLDGAELTQRAANAADLGYQLIESTPLGGKSRSFNAAFQRPGKYEHVIRLTKP